MPGLATTTVQLATALPGIGCIHALSTSNVRNDPGSNTCLFNRMIDRYLSSMQPLVIPAFHSQTNIDLCMWLLVCIFDLFVVIGWPGAAALPIMRGPDSFHHIYCIVYSKNLRKLSSRLAPSLPFTPRPCSHSTVNDIVIVRVTSMWERGARGIGVFFHELIQLTLHPSDRKRSSCQWAR